MSDASRLPSPVHSDRDVYGRAASFPEERDDRDRVCSDGLPRTTMRQMSNVMPAVKSRWTNPGASVNAVSPPQTSSSAIAPMMYASMKTRGEAPRWSFTPPVE